MPVTLFLAGDVMTGRGVDQVLPHPGNPQLYESYITSAVDYVALAEKAHGAIPKPVDFAYVWGDALAELERRRPDVRLVNLETAVTKSDERAAKEVNYKMNPANLGVLAAAKIDCCILANNHVLDWGYPGLLETLEALEAAGIKAAGAGRNSAAAAAPAVFATRDGGRVLVFAFGSVTSGIPDRWRAAEREPGVNLLPDLSPQTVGAIGTHVRSVKKPGDIAVASIHWGANWGYEIPGDQTSFAHGLIDSADIDVVHGHSSHHPKAIEVYQGRPIIYGCGDFLDDYEGISGYERFRDDLALMYLPAIDASRGTLIRLDMVPFQLRSFKLNRASPEDSAWLRDTLDRERGKFGTRVELGADNALTLAWK